VIWPLEEGRGCPVFRACFDAGLRPLLDTLFLAVLLVRHEKVP
jgi:hypothetical protein